MHSLTAYRPNELTAPVPGEALRRLESLRQRLQSAATPGMPGSVPQEEILRMLGEAFAHAPATGMGLHGVMRHAMPQAGMPAYLDRARVAKILGGVNEIIDALREPPARPARTGVDGILDEVERALDTGLARLAVSGLKEALDLVHVESVNAFASDMGMGMYRPPHSYGGSTRRPSLESLRENGLASHEETNRLGWLENGSGVRGTQDMRASVVALREIGRRVAGAVPRIHVGYPSGGMGADYPRFSHYD